MNFWHVVEACTKGRVNPSLDEKAAPEPAPRDPGDEERRHPGPSPLASSNSGLASVSSDPHIDDEDALEEKSLETAGGGCHPKLLRMETPPVGSLNRLGNAPVKEELEGGPYIMVGEMSFDSTDSGPEYRNVTEERLHREIQAISSQIESNRVEAEQNLEKETTKFREKTQQLDKLVAIMQTTLATRTEDEDDVIQLTKSTITELTVTLNAGRDELQEIKGKREELDALAKESKDNLRQIRLLREEHQNEVFTMREVARQAKQTFDSLMANISAAKGSTSGITIDILEPRRGQQGLDSDVLTSDLGALKGSGPAIPSKVTGKRTYVKLKGIDKVYTCKACGIHIGHEDKVTSKSYQVGKGSFCEKKRGFLFKETVNLFHGPLRTEAFSTGTYQICRVRCLKCYMDGGKNADLVLGWKYVACNDEKNRTKEGHYCLARIFLHAQKQRKRSRRSQSFKIGAQGRK